MMERMEPSVCDSKDVDSRVATLSNRQLHEEGVVVRTIDIIDGFTVWKNKKFYSQDKIQYLPASFFHASMRAPNPMFRYSLGKRQVLAAGVMIKTNINPPTTNSEAYLNITLCYPMDAGTMDRRRNGKGVLLTDHGGACGYKDSARCLSGLA